MMHLSRWSEELVLCPHRSSASSICQTVFVLAHPLCRRRKTPDVPELVRGKTGRVYGALISLLTLMKSQPLAYNKDNEDKNRFLTPSRTLQDCLRALSTCSISSPMNAMRTLRSRGSLRRPICRLSRETGRSLAMHTTSWANSLALRSNDKWTCRFRSTHHAGGVRQN